MQDEILVALAFPGCRLAALSSTAFGGFPTKPECYYNAQMKWGAGKRPEPAAWKGRPTRAALYAAHLGPR